MRSSSYSQRLNTIEQRTRRFLVGAAVVLLLVLAMIAARQDYFSRSVRIYFITPNAQGLSKGMAVKFIGFKVGSVQEVRMQPDATVRVQIALNDEYVHLIGQDAKARLVKEALVGESVVELIPGSQQVRQVVEGSVLEFERGQDAGTVVESLAGQLQPILSDIHQITSSGDIQQTLRHLNHASSELRETIRQFTQVGANGNQAVTSLNSSLEAIEKSVPELLKKADTALGDVQSAVADIKRITSDSAAEIPALVRNTNTLVQDGQETLKGVQQSWLFNGLFTPAEEQRLPVDGYVPPQAGK